MISKSGWLVAALLVGLVSCTSQPAVAPDAGSTTTAQVSIAGFAFDPAVLTVSRGTTVTWTNTDTAGHTVSADDTGFDSGTLATDGTFSRTFDQAGTFGYHCELHPRMTATVTVTEQ